MHILHLREQLSQEIARIPDDRLGEVFSVVHFFRLGLESIAGDSPSPKRRSPSPRLANQGAQLLGDDQEPAITLEEWGSLYRDKENPRP